MTEHALAVLDESSINVIRILNPFDPRDHAREVIPFVQGQLLADYFPAGAVDAVVSVNGKIIERADWRRTYLQRGDSLVICPVPQGGGGDSKGVLGMVAMLAVAVFAPYAAGSLMGLQAGTLGYSMAVAGITLAGSMLVHSLFAPSKPTAKDNKAESATYGIDGAKNTALEGIPVPICYGRFRMAGNIISMHVDNEGDNQTLYMLLNAGEGGVSSLDQVEINDNPLSDYEGVEVQVRGGWNQQDVIPWFANSITPYNLSSKLGTAWTYYTTNAPVDRFRLDFVAPNGLYRVNKENGNLEGITVPLLMEYRLAGSSGWTQMSMANIVSGSRAVKATLTTDGSGGSGYTGQYFTSEAGDWYYVDPNSGAASAANTQVVSGWTYVDNGQPVSDADLNYINANGYGPTTQSPTVPIYSAAAQMSASQRNPVRRSYDSGPLANAVYEIRVARQGEHSKEDTVSDEVYLSDVNEIEADPIAYVNTAVVGLKIKLGEQISGIPRVTFMNGGKIISVYGKPVSAATADSWYAAPSSNPAWIVWDMLTNRRYGGGMATSRLDFYAFKRWADYCDQNSMFFNGVIDAEMNVWDASQYVLRVGRAQLVNVGTRWTVVVERQATPTMMFSVANMIEGTYREDWLSVNDRANEVDVTFFDAEDKYRQRTIKIYDPAALTAGQKQRTSAVTLYGVTEYERAYQEGMFMMNLNRFILKTITFQAPLEAVACTVGDLILVQHDMPDWAQAGRTETGSTATVLNLDRPVTMESGKNYQVLVLHDIVGRYSGQITNIAGNTVFVSGYAAFMEGDRLRAVDGPDVAIIERYDGSVTVDSVAGLAIGQTAEIFSTDYVQAADVVLQPGATQQITLTQPLLLAPDAYVQWMFGESAKVRAQFRIKSIDRGNDQYTREIKAIQYDEQVWDNTRFGSEHVPITNPKDVVIGQIRDLDVYEETRIAGTQVVSEVVASWREPHTGVYGGADVYLKRNGETNFSLYTTTNHSTHVSGPAVRGDVVTVKVVAFDIWGKRATFADAPEFTYNVVGEVTNIDVGDVTGADVIWNGRDCRLTWRYNSITHSYEFGGEPLGAGADAGSLDPHFKDYEIRVFNYEDDVSTAQPRRVEYTTDNSYTYTYDKNHADGLTRKLKFAIAMRDIFNNVGAPAVLTAYNPAPRLTSLKVTTTFESASISYEHSDDSDFAGALVWISQDQTAIAGDIYAPSMKEFLYYDGPDTHAVLMKLMFESDYYIRIACYDIFGKTELIPSDVQHFRTDTFDVNAIADGVLSGSKLLPDLQTRINLIDGPIDMAGSVAARLLEEAKARGTDIQTVTTMVQTGDAQLAQQITSITAVVEGGGTAAIQEEITARATADSALASRIDTLAVSVGQNAASIYNEQTARVDADGSLAQQITVLQANWESAKAAYSDEVTVRASADSSLSQQITTLTSTVGSQTATLQETKKVTDGLSAQYTVKIDNNGYVAGFGLASYPIGGGIVSEFGVLADRFFIAVPGQAQNIHPFVVGTVNGIPSVIISRALIGDATIHSAHIGYLEVKESNIDNGAVSHTQVVSSAGSSVTLFSFYVPPGTTGIVLVATGGTQQYYGNGDGSETGSYVGPGEISCDLTMSIDGFGMVASGNGTAAYAAESPPSGYYTIHANRTLGFNCSGFLASMSVAAMCLKK